MNKKGIVGTLIVGMVMIFLFGTLYIIMSKPFDTIYEKMYPQLNESYQPTAQKIQSSWNNWPIVIIVIVLIWMLWRVTRRNEPQVPYY